jgi:tetratricopeptide (TPR) repeat protein
MWGRARFFGSWFFKNRTRFSGGRKTRTDTFPRYNKIYAISSRPRQFKIFGTVGAITAVAIVVSPFIFDSVAAASRTSTVDAIYNDLIKAIEDNNINTIGDETDPFAPLLVRISKLSKEEFESGKQKFFEILNILDAIYAKNQLVKRHAEALQIAHTLCKKFNVFDEDPLIMLSYAEKLGHAYYSLGRIDDSRQVYEEFLAFGKKLAEVQMIPEEEFYPVGHGHRLVGSVSTGNKAKEHFLKAIAIFDKILSSGDVTLYSPSDHEIIQREKIDSYISFGTKMANEGEVDTAIKYLDDASKLLRMIPRPADNSQNFELENTRQEFQIALYLGTLLSDKKEFNKALEHVHKAFDLAKVLFGESELVVLQTKEHLAALLYQTDQIDVAEKYFEELLEEYERLHKDATNTYLYLAQISDKKGDVEKAKNYFNKCLENVKKYDVLREQEQKKSLKIYYQLGNFEMQHNNFVKAEEYYRKAYEILNKSTGNELQKVATASSLGHALADQQKYKEAEKCYLEALRLSEKFFGKESPPAAASLHNIGHFYKTMGDYEKARKYFEESIKVSTKIYGTENHENIAISVQSLGHMFYLKGDYANAQKYLERAIKINETLKTDDSLSTGNIYFHLGRTLHNMNDLKKAAEYYERALSLIERHSPPNGVPVIRLYTYLGDVFAAMGNLTEALSSYEKANVLLKSYAENKEVVDFRDALAKKIASLATVPK